MSQKVDPFNGRKHRRYTKKTPQFGGGTLTYTVKTELDKGNEMLEFLKETGKYTPNIANVVQKISKVTVPKDKRDSFTTKLTEKNKSDGSVKSFKPLDRMCLNNCDYEVITPMEYNVTFTDDEYNGFKLTNISASYTTTLTFDTDTQDDALNAFKYFAKKNKLDVKDSSGKPMPEMSYDEFNEFDKKLKPIDPFRFKDAKYDETKFNELYKELIEDNPSKIGQTTKTENGTTSSDENSGKALSLLLPKPKDQRQKEKMFYILNSIDVFFNQFNAETNNSLLTEKKDELPDVGVGVVDTTRALTTNFLKGTFRFFKRINPFIKNDPKKTGKVNTVPEEFLNKVPKELLVTEITDEQKIQLKQKFVVSVFEDIYLQQDEFANQTTDEGITFKLTEQKADDNGWFLGMIPTIILGPVLEYIRGVVVGYGRGTDRLTFSEDEKARNALRQRRQDADNGVKNEFSLLSAFKGTEGQKTSAKVAIIAGAAAFAWAIVAKIQQNPELAAMVTGAVVSTGAGGVIVAGALIACGVAYYAILKIKEKYSTYYLINRTLNELTILLHRIQKLIRLALLVSHTYNFDIIIGEINEELKIIFSRFDEFLKADDYNGIQGMINANATPDLDMAAVTGKAAAEAKIEIKEADKEAVKVGFFKRLGSAVSNKFSAMKAAAGRFVYTMTLDEKLWNEKLNKDIVRLNIYLTTTIGEFNLVLNVMQMSYISKGLQGGDAGNKAIASFTAKQHHIEQSSEYMRMLIGMLLNDILKLRVDISYCSRGNSKAEKICLDYQDTDGAGNIVTVYRRHLHVAMLTLVEKLDDSTSVYGQHKTLCEKVRNEVVKPYVGMLTNLKNNNSIIVPDEIIKAQEDGFASYFEVLTFKYVRPGIEENKKKLSEKVNDRRDDFNKNLQTAIDKLESGNPSSLVQSGEPPNTSKAELEEAVNTSKAEVELEGAANTLKADQGGGGEPAPPPPPANATQVSSDLENRITKTAEYIISEPYVTIPDEPLSQFLTLVYNFSKKEGKTTEAETKDALKTSIDNAKFAPSPQAVAGANAIGSAVEEAADPNKKEVVGANSKGGRRLTRKRIFKLKKNRRITRIRAPFKSAAVAVAAFRRK
jgi:hypothetical protein